MFMLFSTVLSHYSSHSIGADVLARNAEEEQKGEGVREQSSRGWSWFDISGLLWQH